MSKHVIRLPVSVTVFLFSGCAALPDTTIGHPCGIPHGVGCLSTQEVYDRTVAGTLPGLNQSDGAMLSPPEVREANSFIAMQDAPRAQHTGALYAPPEELRIWVNRWRDQDGDLHDDAFIYVLIGEGQWLVRD